MRLAERPLADDESDGARLGAGAVGEANERLLGGLLVGRKDFVRNVERVEEGNGEPPLGGMLGLVWDSWLAAPADEEDHRDAVDGGIGEGEKGVDGVAFAGVLEIDEGKAPGGEVMPGGEGDGPALVRRDHVAKAEGVAAETTGECGAEPFEKGIGNAGEEVDTMPVAGVEEEVRIDHGGKLARPA